VSFPLFPDQPATALVGIAKLAASGETLESKRRVEYRELPTRSILNRCPPGSRMPFQWTINPYRGCEFGCKYCYARYTHEFLELRRPEEFEQIIYAKQWDPAGFREDLAKVTPRERIAIGTATDPYQPAERRFVITRRILEVFAREGGRRLSLVTKSDLVVRDKGLLVDIARRNELIIHLTITTTDAELARLVEPLAPRPELRLKALAELAAAGLRVGVLCCPILPRLNDSMRSLEAVASAASSAGACSLAGGVVYLKPAARRVFFPFLEAHFPQLVERYRERFRHGAFLHGDYPDAIGRRLRAVRARYKLDRAVAAGPAVGWPEEPQMRLEWG